MNHALHEEHEEDRAMCIICYTLCAVCVAIFVAVLMYVVLH